jgi:hypothetical protein
MSGRVLSFEVVILCTSLASAACAPDTDESPLSSPSTATTQTRGAAGAPAAGGAAHAAAGAPALPSTGAAGLGAPGMSSIPTTVGVAGRAPLAGMPAAAGSIGRGPMGAAGMGPIAMNPMAGTPPLGAAGMSGSAGGAATGTGGQCGSGTPTDGRPTTGPLACIVEQHNAVRAKVMSMMPLAPVTWNADMAKYAQEWTDMTCMSPKHRSNPSLNGQRLGENLYASFGSIPDPMPGKAAVDGWAAEVACYTYGKFESGDKCDMNCTSQMNSDGCGHYTQVVWRASTQIGCGVTNCGSGRNMQTAVICNYAPAGNFVGMLPY